MLFLGRLAETKGVPELLRSWESRPWSPPAALVLVGIYTTGDGVPPIEEREDVIVRDWTYEPADYYRAADIFVLPTHSEGMSGAVMEAMACGLGVITTPAGSAGDLIDDGKEGLLAPVRDSRALGEAWRRLIDDPALRRALGASAALKAQRWTIGATVDQIEAVYRRLAPHRD